MKITLTSGEVSKIVLKYLRDTNKIPTTVRDEDVKRTITNLTRLPHEGPDDVELVHYRFDLP